jgi:type I toxin-antitoxin system toxin SymE
MDDPHLSKEGMALRAEPMVTKEGAIVQPGIEVPFLPLCGRWLRDAGFDIGRNVKVEVSEGRLTIERVD